MIVKTRATKTVKISNNEVIWEKVNQSITITLDDENLSLSDLDVAHDKIMHAFAQRIPGRCPEVPGSTRKGC